jgi:hypothetical protein
MISSWWYLGMLELKRTFLRLRFIWEDSIKVHRNIKNDNISFERAEAFKYLEKNKTNQNFIQDDIKSRLKSGNACYHSVQNLLSSSLLSKKLKIKIYRTIILPVVLYECKTWSLTLRKERRLRCMRIGCWGEYLGPRGTRWQGSGENYIIRSLMICTPHSILFGW